MNKIKLFLENFIVYGLGGTISKLVPLIMIPIVTRLVPDTTYFGISDMSNTVVSFGSALAVMGMYDAMYRMFFEKEDEDYRKRICSTVFIFTVLTSMVIFIIMILFKEFISDKFFGDTKYGYLVYITAIATLIGATNSIVSAPTRMKNKRKVFIVMNIVTALLSYSISIPLLLMHHYIIALPLAGLIAAIASEAIFLFINKEWFSLKKIDFSLLKPLLMIGVPLLPNFLIYWVFNSSDKVMITNLIGTNATGIYSVGAKLGQASQLIYTAFAGGWQFFAFTTMNEVNQVESNSKIFEYLGIISFSCSMFVFSLAEPIYRVVFTGDYVSGYIISPYLFLAPLLQMLFQVACNQFLIVKKTWPNMFILLGGAVVNVLLNLYLIPRIGIEGSAIATLIGYIVSDVVCVVILNKMKLMVISGRFIISTLMLVGFIVLWRFFIKTYVPVSLLFSSMVCLMYLRFYWGDVKLLLENLKKTNR
jgi:O-antigen/teichoic acid export membrane protein